MQHQQYTEEGGSAEMPKYQSHKKVWALKIKHISYIEPAQYQIVPEESGYAPIDVSTGWMEKHQPQVGGYYVVYKDGYASYSPAAAFEEGYTKL